MVQSAQPAGAAQPGNDLRVCVRCGIIAPGGVARCAVCDEALGVRGHTVQCLLPGRPWARVELVLPCAHCGQEFPPRPEALEGPAVCPHCQQATHVEPAWWDEAVHLAHAVVDLAHPDFTRQNEALGSYNPFADVGLREPFANLPSERLPMQSPMRLRVGPGAPLCLRCGTPVVVRVLTQGRQTTECPQCGDRDAYAVPRSLVGRIPALRALLGFATESAAAQGRIEPWWLLLEGPSTLRPLVATQKDTAEKQAAERAAWEAWNLQERERQEREARLQAAQAEREAAERARSDKAARERAERENLERGHRDMQGQLAAARARIEELERTLQATEAHAEEVKRGLEQSVAAAHEAHRADAERMHHEAWSQGEQARGMMAQQESQWRAQDQRRQQELEAQAQRHTKRWRIAIGLWVLFFVAVAADLLLAVR